ncbi:MAG: molybdate ABC transporter permease subunit [Nitrospirae bacterium]|nr:molybdate ABC transporter permease subunit [Nitrospirota bacterium]
MDEILSPFYLSLLVASTATVLITVLGLALAYVLEKCEFRGKTFLDALVTVPIVLPPTVVGYYLILLFGRNGLFGKPIYQATGFSFTFSWEGAVLASTVVALPLMVKVSMAAIRAVDPELIHVSYSLGKSEWRTFFQIILPIAKGGVMAGIVLSFARALGEFGATLMIAGNIPGKTSTMPLAIYSAFEGGHDQRAQALALLLTLFSIATVYLAGHWTRKIR